MYGGAERHWPPGEPALKDSTTPQHVADTDIHGALPSGFQFTVEARGEVPGVSAVAKGCSSSFTQPECVHSCRRSIEARSALTIDLSPVARLGSPSRVHAGAATRFRGP
jgi:hypothetical protein